MRVAILFLIGLTTLFVCCRTSVGHQAAIRLSDENSLGKYSYLIYGLRHNPLDPGKRSTVSGTGFFIRKNRKLLFVTAYHILTACDINSGNKRDEIIDTLDVVYTDTLGRHQYQKLPLTDHKNLLCKSYAIFPDVDTMDVTKYFIDGNIFSIEQFLLDQQHGSPAIKKRDKLVCYGYPDIDVGKYLSVNEEPWRKLRSVSSRIVQSPAESADTTSKIYYNIFPVLTYGYSGAPVFRIRSDKLHDRIVEFAGIQSGTDSLGRFSWVVKESFLQKKIN